MSNFRPVERELKDRKGSRFSLRILPYRTADNKIEGAVIAIMEIHPELSEDQRASLPQ